MLVLVGNVESNLEPVCTKIPPYTSMAVLDKSVVLHLYCGRIMCMDPSVTSRKLVPQISITLSLLSKVGFTKVEPLRCLV